MVKAFLFLLFLAHLVITSFAVGYKKEVLPSFLMEVGGRLEARIRGEVELPLAPVVETRLPPVVEPVLSESAQKPFRIITPFSSDVFSFDPHISAPQLIELRATAPADWVIDGVWVGAGQRFFWSMQPGRHSIAARFEGQERTMWIEVLTKS